MICICVCQCFITNIKNTAGKSANDQDDDAADDDQDDNADDDVNDGDDDEDEDEDDDMRMNLSPVLELTELGAGWRSPPFIYLPYILYHHFIYLQ